MEISLEPAQKQPQTVHLLPCQIDHNGPAQVSTYFVQTDGVDPLNGGPCKVAAFRGRQLFGVTNRLPSELKGMGFFAFQAMSISMIFTKAPVVGHVYSERRHSDDMEDETTANHGCIEIFDEFTVWKHDHAPDTKSDPFFVAMEWNNIATHVRQRLKGTMLVGNCFAKLTNVVDDFSFTLPFRY
ncbi:hypothetical protein INT44_006773 [Umbelopsis vinacea]|uniref:Uncharacterized protein n=1 Tax=Umbelopsis vinacea TaxID=44442 RepID=A0A8H7PIQ2_9FUNG|nr:hypothetical protein INT44_006773 [Umbelopsis vinacea]